MKEEQISIIVIAYNTEKYIKKCLESISKQTYANLEILVILDGCTDKTEQIVEKYAKKENRLRILTQNNKGTCYSRILGYQSAKGKYIMYVDSDDWIEKNMVATMYQNLLEYQVDVVRCQYKRYKNQELKIPKNILNRNVKMNVEQLEPQFFDLLYHTNNCNSICRQLIRKRVMTEVKHVDKKLLYHEDLACNVAIYKKMKSILFLPDELYIYRRNPEGITKSCDPKLIEKRIADMCQVHYDLYISVTDFGIKDKKYYKKLAVMKMCYQLTYLFYQLYGTKLFKKREFIQYIEAICNQKPVKEMLEFLRKNQDTVTLKEFGLSTYQTTNHLLEEKYHSLYLHYKWIYHTLLLLEAKEKH